MHCDRRAGCTADVYLPLLPAVGGSAAVVTDGPATVWKTGSFMPGTAGVESGRMDTDDKFAPVPSVVLGLKSGKYSLRVATK